MAILSEIMAQILTNTGMASKLPRVSAKGKSQMHYQLSMPHVTHKRPLNFRVPSFETIEFVSGMPREDNSFGVRALAFNATAPLFRGRGQMTSLSSTTLAFLDTGAILFSDGSLYNVASGSIVHRVTVGGSSLCVCITVLLVRQGPAIQQGTNT